MELKVREVTGEEKSQQEIEQALLDKHEQEVNNETPQAEEPQQETPPVQEEAPVQESKSELSDDDVLSYIKKRTL